MVVTKSDFSASAHAFNEVKINGSWVQADSSVTTARLILDETSVYQKWDWYPRIGKDYSIFAFGENGICEDVTSRYTK